LHRPSLAPTSDTLPRAAPTEFARLKPTTENRKCLTILPPGCRPLALQARARGRGTSRSVFSSLFSSLMWFHDRSSSKWLLIFYTKYCSGFVRLIRVLERLQAGWQYPAWRKKVRHAAGQSWHPAGPPPADGYADRPAWASDDNATGAAWSLRVLSRRLGIFQTWQTPTRLPSAAAAANTCSRKSCE